MVGFGDRFRYISLGRVMSPYKLVKVRGGYKVKSPSGYRSKKALSKSRAKRQLRAIYANTKGK